MLRKAPPCGPVSSAAREKSWVGGGLRERGSSHAFAWLRPSHHSKPKPTP